MAANETRNYLQGNLSISILSPARQSSKVPNQVNKLVPTAY